MLCVQPTGVSADRHTRPGFSQGFIDHDFGVQVQYCT